MIHIESTTQINRPRDAVFALLQDIDTWPRWQRSLVKVRHLTTGPLRVGFQFQEIGKMGPWELKTELRVTDIKENERFCFEATSSLFDCQGNFDLQPVAGGTRLTLRGRVQLKGLLVLPQPIFGVNLRKEMAGQLASAKQLLEAGADAQVRAMPRMSN